MYSLFPSFEVKCCIVVEKIGPPPLAQATKVADAKAAEHDVKKLKFRLGSGLITAGMLNLMK